MLTQLQRCPVSIPCSPPPAPSPCTSVRPRPPLPCTAARAGLPPPRQAPEAGRPFHPHAGGHAPSSSSPATAPSLLPTSAATPSLSPQLRPRHRRSPARRGGESRGRGRRAAGPDRAGVPLLLQVQLVRVVAGVPLLRWRYPVFFPGNGILAAACWTRDQLSPLPASQELDQ
ncbi:hypothetical protein PVAP13_1KG149000 [Panicum virgatum]|uniref:Uncharacterized protein n=1 Tax=Panicum virgatum TaxID=38727 RepID=A0A8T0XHZ2_PANVG|nr:hypothetical protein PVAP13_1KG149000 [Panicum virgatum]